MSHFRHDLKNALRQLAKRPALSGLIVLILAFGIGANAAIFTLADAALFRGLPVEQPDRLVRVFTASDRPRTDYSNASMPQFRDLQRELTSFESMAAFTETGVHVAIGDGTAERYLGVLVTGGFFELIGVRPHLGRLLGPADNETVNGHPVAVVSHHFWRTRLNSSEDAVGRTALTGVAIGAASALLVPYMKSQVYGISTYDPISFVLAMAAVFLFALLACLWPARRAARIQPTEALRYE